MRKTIASGLLDTGVSAAAASKALTELARVSRQAVTTLPEHWKEVEIPQIWPGLSIPGVTVWALPVRSNCKNCGAPLSLNIQCDYCESFNAK